MTLSMVQLGSVRRDRGLRIGAVRRLPRGVPKEDYSKLDYFDVWLPILSPSLQMLKSGKKGARDPRMWDRFKRAFKIEMKQPDAVGVIAMLSALSHQTDISVGCYCANEHRCHRSVLRELLAE
jgi:uncharacterized protein YeaO (DUF488 family)